MAPSPSPRLLRALLSASSRPGVGSTKPAAAAARFLSSPSPQQVEPLIRGVATPWRQALLRSFSSGNGGGGRDDGDDGGEPRLFGEGGLFGKSASPRRSSDDWEEQEGDEQPPPWSDTVSGQAGEPWRVDDEPQVADAYTTAGDAAGGEEGMGAVAFETGPPVGGLPWEAGAAEQEWIPEEEEGPAYIGEWAPDGRLLKAGVQPPQGDPSSDPAFGELIRKSGFTHDDIANLMAGFYEPVGLPHLDDIKYADVEGERKKQRRELELAKMEEMAKRWVRKVDENGFAHGVGRRKASSARVWIREGEGRIVINKKHHDLYFTLIDHRVVYLEPFLATDTMGMFDAFVLVKGGGVSGQAGAVRLGVSRALMWYDPSLRSLLKQAGMLRRDPRIVERKKPGKAKARKSFQWVKR